MSRSIAVKVLGKVSALVALTLVVACTDATHLPGASQSQSESYSAAGFHGATSSLTSLAATSLYRDGSRLAAHYWSGVDGSRQFEGSWYDTQRDEDCKIGYDENGVNRCLPLAGAVTTNYFMDSACTQPAVATFQGMNVPAYITTTVPAKDGSWIGNKLNKVISTMNCSELYMMANGTCLAVDWGGSPPQSCSQTGDQIPATEFVSFTRQ